jgi:hypothetical protein
MYVLKRSEKFKLKKEPLPLSPLPSLCSCVTRLDLICDPKAAAAAVMDLISQRRSNCQRYEL